ncbi:MAG TPA: hypothetical protein VLT85_01295 [Terriglobales bacterium]|nr:hypothetical protein [Terriglobales bacterium]
MRAWLQVGLLVALSGVLAASGLGQSVAEAARQEQARKSSARPAQRVYTNDDFPATLPETIPSSPTREKEAPPAAQSKKPSAEEVRSAVLAQKQKLRALDARLADLERQLDEWNNANLGTTCNTYGVYNPYQTWCQTPQVLLLERDRVQSQRDQAQRDLEQMQEEARRMGFRSVVYDPD